VLQEAAALRFTYRSCVLD